MTSRKSVVQYILNEVLELSPETTKKLIEEHEYNTVVKLRNASERTLLQLVEQNSITTNDQDMLVLFQNWYHARRAAGILIPGSLKEWKETLTADNVDDFQDDISKKHQEHPLEVVKPSRTSTVSVRLSDYPIFRGTQQTWNDFKQTFVATALLTQVGCLLDVQDMEEHKKKRESDPDYDMIVRDLYGILSSRTAGGLAAARVTKHCDTHDGVLAWRDLLEYWDLSGNKDAYGSQKFAELMNLQYKGSAYGGIDGYINKFESNAVHGTGSIQTSFSR
jgi:hypothetical protein